ncbi:MAG: hypothetical protein RBQ66_03185 [Candidatus Cloacimonadaceae bacterium]|jgi:hypothetical protein|nr:hypothetical protein [Candidatus Cloacimonadaceae bacterium]
MNRFFLLLALVSVVYLDAQALPFYANWQSSNTIYYDSAQVNKELSWNELYRAEFGLRNLVHKGFKLNLALSTEQFFDESHIKLHTMRIEGKISPYWSLEAGTYEHGFGGNFEMDNQPVLMRGYQHFNYQIMRMNSLAVSYNPESSNNIKIKLDLGGNTHNQSSGAINCTLTGKSYTFNASQEVRTMDNHWRTPVTITGIDIVKYGKKGYVRANSALAILPQWDSTDAHHELFGQTEVLYQLSENMLLGIGACFTSKEYAPQRIQRYQLRIKQMLSQRIDLVPLSQISILDNNKIWQQRLILNYNPLQRCNIAIYYDYSHFEASEGRHTLGISLDFGLDLSSAPDNRRM